MSKDLPRYLTTMDASFLYAERDNGAMHIGGLMIYEGRIEREELAALLRAGMHLIPRYRQRVVFPPMSVSHPFWVDDPNFDVDNHIEVVQLTGEVDDERLSEEAARAYSGVLDRSRPLWSAVMLHGLPNDSTGIVWKIHHAMVDGVSGVDLTLMLNSLTPEAELPAPPETEWRPEPLPDALSLLQEGVQHRLQESTRAWTDATFDLFRPETMTARASRMTSGFQAGLPQAMRLAPRTSFNRRVSGKIAFAWAGFSFTEIRQVKNELGGTVNDLVLAILAGGLGRYMRERGENTKGKVLRAMCPVSMRQADERGQLGNLVSVMNAPLFVDEQDPVARLALERGEMDKLKGAGQAEALYEMNRLGDFVPPTLQGMMSLFPIPGQRVFNTVSTNVPGPQVPLYQAGRKLLSWIPMGVVSSNIGLFVGILTYNGRLTLGVTVDREQVTEPWAVSRALKESFEELRDAAGVEIEETPLEVRRPSPPGRSRKPRQAVLARSETTKRSKQARPKRSRKTPTQSEPARPKPAAGR